MQSPLRISLIAAALLASGCDGPVLDAVAPAPGEESASVDAVVEARFRLPPDDPSLHLSRPWGTTVPGDMFVEDLGRTIVFEPTGRLDAGGEYVARLTWAGEDDPTVWGFRVHDGRHLPQGTLSARPVDERSGILRGCPPDERCFNQSPPPLSSVP